MTTNIRQNPMFGKSFPQSSGNQQQNRRPGGGWGDDNEDIQLKNVGNTYGENKVKTQDNQLKVKTQPESPSVYQSKQQSMNNMQLKVEECNENFLEAHQYENKIINGIIQPGGARVKQPDSALLEFCNTSEHLEPSIVGSILLSKFNEQIGWIPKARVIFAIEALSKKFNRYFDYFKHNIAVLQKVGFTAEGPYANQLRKFMDSLMYILNHPAYSAELQKENQFFSKPIGPSLPHNNSQGESNKQKAVQLFAAKSSSLPSDHTQQEAPGSNFVNLKTAKDSEQKSAELGHTDLLDIVAPASSNGTSNPKIPLEKANDLANCLSDIDFTTDNTKSPNSLYNLYQGPSPMNYYGATSPTGFVGGYSPAYYNYPVNNQAQGGFNSYVQASSVQYQQNNNNNNFDQYGNVDIFNQPTGIDYNKEETDKQKKREEIEKRFESLNFK